VNDNDDDNDGIPDFADGYGLDPSDPDDIAPPSPAQGERFVPVVLELPPAVNLSAATLQFKYNDADPLDVHVTGTGPEKRYFPEPPGTAEPGFLRIWRKDGSTARNPASLAQDPAGDYVPATGVHGYGPAELSALVLYLEAVRPSDDPGDQRVEVIVDPDGTGPAPPCEDALRLTNFAFRLVDAAEDKVDFSTSFSHPHPKVTIGRNADLDPFAIGDIDTEGAPGPNATVHIFGEVLSPMADLIDDPAADIDEVTILVRQVNTTGAIEQITVPVTNASSSATEDFAPPGAPSGPYRGTFDAEVTVPLTTGSVTVAVRATNVLGNEGYDSFTIEVGGAEFDASSGQWENNGVSSGVLAGVTNPPSTPMGLFNPVWIYIDDPSLDVTALPSGAVSMFGQTFDLVERDGAIGEGRVRADRAFWQVARDLTGGVSAPNVRNALDFPEVATAAYRGIERKLEWNYTRGSPPNYLKYAAGTKVLHLAFSRYLAEGWSITEAEIWEVESPDFLTTPPPARSIQRDTDTSVTVGGALMSLDGKAGVALEIDTTNASLENPNKRLWLTAQKNGRTVSFWGGDFHVVPLSVAIVAVDGLGYDSAQSVIGGASPGPTFRQLFEGAVEHTQPALAALPTITWANWPGVFGGHSPAGHGILGNSYFPRDIPTPSFGIGTRRFPVNSANREFLGHIDGRQQGGIAFGGGTLFDMWSMPARALPGAGSLYQEIADVSGAITAHSIGQFYDPSSPDVDLRGSHFGITSPNGHNLGAATGLDTEITDQAEVSAQISMGFLDVLTMYFPGPDNIGHAVGADSSHPAGLSGGDIGEVTDPVPSVGEYAVQVTDAQLKRVVDVMEERGYFNAVLFALVADHGLIAVENQDAFNITSDDGDPGFELQALFDDDPALDGELGMRMWRNSGDILIPHVEVNDFRSVYSPDGGLGQVYIRPAGQMATWQEPPTTDDLDAVASLIFREAQGHDGQIYDELAPRGGPNPTHGALGDPPAVFVKVDPNDETANNFLQAYRWVREVGPGPDFVPVYDSISKFIEKRSDAGNPVDWPAFKARLEQTFLTRIGIELQRAAPLKARLAAAGAVTSYSS